MEMRFLFQILRGHRGLRISFVLVEPRDTASSRARPCAGGLAKFLGGVPWFQLKPAEKGQPLEGWLLKVLVKPKREGSHSTSTSGRLDLALRLLVTQDT